MAGSDGRNWRESGKLRAVATLDAAVAMVVEVLRRLLFKPLAPRPDQDPGRILVFRIGNVGDVVAATPVLSAIRLRFPKAHIALLTSPGMPGALGAQELIRPGSLVDSLIVYHNPDISTWTGRWRLIQRIRSQRFELFIELSNIVAPFRQVMQSMLLARLAGCRHAIGFQVAPSRRFPRVQALHIPFPRESERLFRDIAPSLDLPHSGSGRLAIDAGDHREVSQLLERKGVSAADRVVVVHVSAKRPANRWFADRFAAVADSIQIRHGMRVVFTGAPAEQELIQQVQGYMRTPSLSLCGELGLLQTAALLERASLYLGNDTGPMHIAAVMGTPIVAIFSARDFPLQWYPHGNGHVVLRQDVPCSPCFKNVCDVGLTCLDRIGTDEVLNAVEQQLARDHTARSDGPQPAPVRLRVLSGNSSDDGKFAADR